MTGFTRRNGQLLVEDIPLADIARQFQTPCYVYSRRTICESISNLRNMFPRSAPRIFYAVKANGNLSLLRIFLEQGCGFDIVSGGELARALAAGADAKNIVFSGVGKSEVEIRAALSAGVGCINVESEPELSRLESISADMKLQAPVAVRTMPDVDGDTHPHLTTGVRGGKFGVLPYDALQLAKIAHRSSHLQFRGFACHIGSQITDAGAYADAAKRMGVLLNDARDLGIDVHHLDMGGGFAVNYQTGNTDFAAEEYDAELSERFAKLEVWIEPGRSAIAAAGVLLTKVEYVKESARQWFWIVDAGMNDIMRPALYDSYHRVEPVTEGGKMLHGAVAGPVCESADILARECRLPSQAGDILAIRDTGAYCASMFSSYNARLRPCEVLVSGKDAKLIRPRETEEEMLAAERKVL